jgi:predicted enzyme related to lactoylglutathione lyase
MDTKDARIDYVEFPAGSVDALNRTKEFFSSVFGWNYALYGDDYADTADSGVSSGINAENPAPAVLPVIYVKDLQGTYDKVKASGAVIVREIFSFPGGKRFHFKDPSGNELAAWSERHA